MPLVLINVLLYLYFFIKGKRVKISHWKYAIKICIPFVPHLLSLTVLATSDRTMITAQRGAEETALYSIVYTIASIVTILWTSINTAFSPWLGEKIYEKNNVAVNKVSTSYVLIIATLVLGIMLIAPEVLMVIGGNEYMQAIYVVPPIILGCLFQYVYTMYVNVEQFLKKTLGMAVASVVAAAINIVLNLLLIPYYGYMRPHIQLLFHILFLLVFHYMVVRSYKMTNYFNTKNIAIIC
jgi:O-antigen/teichoic acid export membrane protein